MRLLVHIKRFFLPLQFIDNLGSPQEVAIATFNTFYHQFSGEENPGLRLYGFLIFLRKKAFFLANRETLWHIRQLNLSM